MCNVFKSDLGYSLLLPGQYDINNIIEPYKINISTY